jgi:kynurenine formamidase
VSSVVPEFDDLPKIEKLGLRHAWGVFGDDDQLGAVNFLTPERVLRAAGLARTGEVFNVVLPLNAFNPPLYGRAPLEHSLFQPDRNSWDDRLDVFFLQSSTHWDGLRHIRAREFGFWGGAVDETLESGSGPLGIEHWVEHGFVGRGVLLDVAKKFEAEDPTYDPFEERSVTAADLQETADAQGVELQPGDILCLRLGWMGAYQAQDAAGKDASSKSYTFVGLAADEELSRWLWNRNIVALACDNPAAEVSPGDPAVGSLHRRLVPLLGMVLGELFDFERLAAACSADRRYDFLFVSVPLNLPGGVGSPANAVAIR